MAQMFQTFGAVAGLAGLCIGLMLAFLTKLIQRWLTERLSASQAYKVLRLATIATWTVAIFGIGSWTTISLTGGGPGKGGDISIRTTETTRSNLKLTTDGGNSTAQRAGDAGSIDARLGKTTDTSVDASARGGSTTEAPSK